MATSRQSWKRRSGGTAVAACGLLLALVAVAGPSRAAYPQTPEEWIGPMGPDNAWTYTLAIDPNLAGVLYTSTASIYKSADGGSTWTAKNHGVRTSRKIVEIAVDPNDSATLYAVSHWDGEIYKSIDGGDSWSSMVVLAVRGTFHLAVDPADSSTLYVVHWDGGVYKSGDGGETWGRLTGFPDPPGGALAFDPHSPGTVHVGVYNGVAQSTDGGATWTTQPLGVPANLPVAELAFDPLVEGTLYAAVPSDRFTPEGGCYKSVDGGATWSQVLQRRSVRNVGVDPQAPMTVYAAFGGAVLKSTDAGATWTTHVPGFGAHGITDLAIDPLDPSTLYVAARNCCDASPAVVKSTDGGLTWAPANGGIKILASIAVDPLDPERLYAANGWGGAYRSVDGGQTWERIDRDAAGERIYLYWGSIVPAPAPNAVHLYALSNGGFLKSDDRGGSWRLANEGLPADWVGPLRVHPETPDTLYLGSDTGLFRSLDAGETWSLLADLGQVRALAVDPSTPATLLVGAWGTGLFKSTDGGSSWTRLSDYPWWRGALEIDPDSTIYAATLTGLEKSTDGGATWTGQPTWTNGLLIDPLDARILYVASVGDGVLRSVDSGATWTAIVGLPDTQMVLSSMAFDPELPSTLYVVFRGVYRITFAPRVSALTPANGIPGDAVVLSGRNFRPGRGESTVTFNGIPAEIDSWSDTEIVARVPAGRTTGPVQVTVLGQASNTDHWFALDYLPVEIDLKPGSYPNCLRIDGHGVIPVAVLGSESLDVSEVDPSSLALAGLAVRVRGNDVPQCSLEDVGGDRTTPEGAPDGLPDLVCQFVDDPAAWNPGSDTATLEGALFGGMPIRGSDEICVVP